MAKRGFFGRLKEQLGKTRSGLVESVRNVVTGRKLSEEVYEEIEEILIGADVGVETALALVQDMRERAKADKLAEPEDVLNLLKEELIQALEMGDATLELTRDDGPHVTLVAGVNGSGKTTTVGKLAAKLKDEGKSVLLGAADTFRAGAIEQLVIWSERADVPLVKHQEGSDPAAVAYDAVDSAVSRGVDSVLIDTAGRLHTKVNLMEELKKVQRVVDRRLPGAPHEVLLVLDATTGQNGLQQAKLFTEALHVTGLVLTKLDGTAKGGVVIPIQKQLGIPIKLIGVGEQIEDLQPFDPREFVDALFA